MITLILVYRLLMTEYAMYNPGSYLLQSMHTIADLWGPESANEIAM